VDFNVNLTSIEEVGQQHACKTGMQLGQVKFRGKKGLKELKVVKDLS